MNIMLNINLIVNYQLSIIKKNIYEKIFGNFNDFYNYECYVLRKFKEE